ncbi:MAG: EpsG family protein [Caldimonas sp.]
MVLPIAAFALAVFLLINLPAGTSRSTRLMLATTAAIGLSMMTGARPLDPSAPNDIDVYYDIYQQLAAGHTEYLGTYGGGLEFAMPLLCWLWALLLPPLSVNGLMFCFALTSSVLLLVWVEKAFYLDRRWQDPALMGVCILMLNLYFSTQLVRQFLALIVLLYAITAQSRSKQWLYVALATTFHLTALPFYAIYLLARRGLPGWVALVVIAFAVRVSFWELVAAFDVVPVALADKLAYYVDNSQEFTDADLTSLRMIGLLGFVSLVALLSNRFRVDRKTRDWLAVPWVTALMHLVLLPIPLASLRTTLMVHSVVPGLIAYQMLWRKAGVVLLTVLNVFFVYKTVTLIAAPDSGNLLPTVAMVGAFLT